MLESSITLQSVKISDSLSVEVGQVLKQNSLKDIQNEMRNNLQILVNSGVFDLLEDQIQKLKLKVNEDVQVYHHHSGLAQFAGLNQKIAHYQFDKDNKNIKEDLFAFQQLINNIRSAVLGLPSINYSVAVQDINGNYYYITEEERDTSQLLLGASNGRINKNKMTTNSSLTKVKIQDIINKLEEDTYRKHLSFHFSDMMNQIPQLSNPPSRPHLSWAAQVFEKHIQQTGEKIKDMIASINWEHGWIPVNNFWQDYHATRPGYDKNGHYLTFATATQGGDVGQTQVKSFRAFKNFKTGYTGYGSVNIINLNNMQDIFSFWMSVLNEIKSNKISNKTINEILSVLLSNEKIRELGYRTIGNIRGLSW